jgi:hypothetical protein
MVGTLDEFRSQLIGGGARANQFRVEINNPPAGAVGLDTRNAAFLCTAAQLPGMTIEEIAVPFRGRNIYIAGDRSFETWAVTFYNDTNFAIRNAMERWNNSLNHLVTGQGLTNHDDYTADLKVSQLDRDDRLLKTYTFVNAFPLSVSAIALTAGGSADIETFDVTFRYQHFVTDGVIADAPSGPF